MDDRYLSGRSIERDSNETVRSEISSRPGTMHEIAWGKTVDGEDHTVCGGVAVGMEENTFGPRLTGVGDSCMDARCFGVIKMNFPRAATKRKARGRGEGGGTVT